MKTNTKPEIPQNTAENYLKIISLELKCHIIIKRALLLRTICHHTRFNFQNKIDIFLFEMLFNLRAHHALAAKKYCLTEHLEF
jgi:hypothetical protein